MEGREEGRKKRKRRKGRGKEKEKKEGSRGEDNCTGDGKEGVEE